VEYTADNTWTGRREELAEHVIYDTRRINKDSELRFFVSRELYNKDMKR
jgi:hypothetical protein